MQNFHRQIVVHSIVIITIANICVRNLADSAKYYAHITYMLVQCIQNRNRLNLYMGQNLQYCIY